MDMYTDCSYIQIVPGHGWARCMLFCLWLGGCSWEHFVEVCWDLGVGWSCILLVSPRIVNMSYLGCARASRCYSNVHCPSFICPYIPLNSLSHVQKCLVSIALFSIQLPTLLSGCRHRDGLLGSDIEIVMPLVPSMPGRHPSDPLSEPNPLV